MPSNLGLKGDIGAIGPDLRSGLTIVAPAENIFPRRELRNFDDVKCSDRAFFISGVDTFAPVFLTMWRERRGRAIVTPAAIAARCLRASFAWAVHIVTLP